MSARSFSLGRRPLAAVAVITVLLLAACGSGGGDRPQGPVTIKVWAWYPAFEGVVDLFNRTHTDIKIEWTNAGTGQDQYTKLQTALKAGKGAPDVVMLEFQELPTFQLTKHLVDMSKYGANDLKGNYVDWAWKQVSNGDAVHAIPVDAGPMAMLYRQDIFEQYGLRVPKTWAEFKEQAQKLKRAAPDKFMTDFGANDGGFMTGLMWQAGARPFNYDIANPRDVSVNANSGAAKKVMSYWEEWWTPVSPTPPRTERRTSTTGWAAGSTRPTWPRGGDPVIWRVWPRRRPASGGRRRCHSGPQVRTRRATGAARRSR
ncbi:ABC transporter substrate-binding protein [Micromonospora sp. LOL_025]|uniref:ABC transporter substrate-binding protein n=1 Tax=Micromonospora sp. LOL_025 TaxID=3345413 RepID=UPI003A8A69D7